MPFGEAPIVENSTVKALLSRQWSKRRPLPAGLLSLLTLLFWGVWLYLVLPLVSLLLWAIGVRLFRKELSNGGYEGLRSSLVAYSSILLVLVGLLALWIAWNVMRYGGSNDRRTVKRTEATDLEVREAFRLDESHLESLRTRRRVCLDLDRDGCVVVIADTLPPEKGPDEPGPDGRTPGQRGRDRM